MYQISPYLVTLVATGNQCRKASVIWAFNEFVKEQVGAGQCDQIGRFFCCLWQIFLQT